VYAGGAFTTAGGNPAMYVARWDGSRWSALGSGMNSWVYALGVSGTNLFAGGWFTTAGGKVSGYAAEALVPAARGWLCNPAAASTSGFRFTFRDGTLGQYYFIQTSPSLTGDSWTDWMGFTYTGPLTVTDSNAAAAPRLFYRAVWSP